VACLHLNVNVLVLFELKLVLHTNGITEIERVSEHGAEGDIWV
jgi:hypothetical protein